MAFHISEFSRGRESKIKAHIKAQNNGPHNREDSNNGPQNREDSFFYERVSQNNGPQNREDSIVPLTPLFWNLALCRR